MIQVNEHINIELLDASHAQPIFDLVNRDRTELREWLPWVDPMQDVSFMSNYIAEVQQRCAAGLEYGFVIMENDILVGRIAVHKIDRQNKIGEIGYWLSISGRGRGIITKCCQAIIDYCFGELSLHRIEIKCAVENRASRKIPEKLGFTEEGILCEAQWVNGQFIDLVLYALLLSERR